MGEREKAYQMVLAELRKVPLFEGKYDAKNGNKYFMYGISTVMESIAYNCGEEVYDEFSKTFFENLQKSVDKAQNE